MSETELQEMLERHFVALENVIASVATQQRPQRWQFRMGDVTAIIAILGLIVSMGQSWAISTVRLDKIEHENAARAPILAKVPQLDWTLSAMNQSIGELKQQTNAMQAQVQEMHDTLIRMGIRSAK